MGHTATEWQVKVLAKLKDAAGADTTAAEATAIGVLPALAQFAVDRPRIAVVDLTPTARYVALPAAVDGWITGWSDVTRIEAPAGETPPARLDSGEWSMTRDVTTPATSVMLLPGELAAGEKARVFFTTGWPTPTATAGDDKVSDVAYEAVTSLAASYLCNSLATKAAMGRQGALPTNFVDGSERARNLFEAAANLRTLYNTFIGLGEVAGTGGSVSSKTLRSVALG